jgi:hypothetical protein
MLTVHPTVVEKSFYSGEVHSAVPPSSWRRRSDSLVPRGQLSAEASFVQKVQTL